MVKAGFVQTSNTTWCAINTDLTVRHSSELVHMHVCLIQYSLYSVTRTPLAPPSMIMAWVLQRKR